jgi:hypothetical protein
MNAREFISELRERYPNEAAVEEFGEELRATLAA